MRLPSTIILALLVLHLITNAVQAQSEGLEKKFHINCGGPRAGQFITEREEWLTGTSSVYLGGLLLLVILCIIKRKKYMFHIQPKNALFEFVDQFM